MGRDGGIKKEKERKGEEKTQDWAPSGMGRDEWRRRRRRRRRRPPTAFIGRGRNETMTPLVEQGIQQETPVIPKN